MVARHYSRVAGGQRCRGSGHVAGPSGAHRADSVSLERALAAVEDLVLGGVISRAGHCHVCLVVVGRACRQAGKRGGEAAVRIGGGDGLRQVAGCRSVLKTDFRGRSARARVGAGQGCPCLAHTRRRAGGGY